MSKLKALVARKFRLDLTQLLFHFMRIKSTVRRTILVRYYQWKLGIPLKEFPPKLVQQVYFPEGFSPGFRAHINAVLALKHIAEIHGVDSTQTALGRHLSMFMYARFDQPDSIELVEELLEVANIRRAVYDKMVELEDINPRASAFSDPAASAQLQMWLDENPNTSITGESADGRSPDDNRA